MKPRTISNETPILRNMKLMHVSTHKKMKDDHGNALNKNYGESFEKYEIKPFLLSKFSKVFPKKRC